MKWIYKNSVQNKLQAVVDDYAPWTVLVTVIIKPVFISFIPDLKFENTPDKFGLPLDDPVKIARERFESQFNPGEMILLGLQFENRINKTEIDKIKNITLELNNVDGVISIKSLLDATGYRWIKRFGVNTLNSFPIISVDEESDTDKIYNQVKMLAEQSIYRKILISEDQHSANMIISIDPAVTSDVPLLKELIEEIKYILEEFNIHHDNYHLVGTPILNTELQNAMRQDLMLFAPLCLGVCLLVLILVFRQWKPVVAGISTAIISMIWTIGVLPLTNTAMSLNLTMIVPVVLSLSLIYSIHYLTGIFIQSDNEFNGEVLLCWREKITPALLCAFTTCLGFLALVSSRLIGIREVGLYVGLGVIISMYMSNFFLPALLKVFGWSGSPNLKIKQKSILEKFCYRIKDTVLSRAGMFVSIVLILTLVIGFGARYLMVETNHLKYLANNRELTKSFKFVDSTFGGVLPLEIIVETNNQNASMAVQEILSFEKEIRQIENIGFVISPADFIQSMEISKDGSRGPFKPLLYLDKNIISNEIWGNIKRVSGYGSFLIRDDSTTQIRISSRVGLIGSSKLRLLVDSVNILAQKYLSNHKVSVTGLSPYFSRVEHYVITTQIVSFSLALIVIIIILGLLSGSIRLGTIVMTVNLIPIIIIVGVMGWVGIPLDITTVMITSITLGIVVDDTIHLVYSYRKSRERGIDELSSLNYSFDHVGLPVIVTTIILFLSFSTLLFSRFMPTVYFGGLAALAILIAWISDLLLLPALIKLITSRSK